jgi:hypothetical protein
MNIQVAVLCDAATAENDKLYLLGAFDTIITQQLPTQQRPVVHPQCAVAVRVTFMPGDEGPHQFAINLINADGRNIMPHFPHTSFEVVLPEDLHFVTRNFTASFQQLQFPEAGLYSVDIRFDDVSRASIPLLVKYAPPGEGA